MVAALPLMSVVLHLLLVVSAKREVRQSPPATVSPGTETESSYLVQSSALVQRKIFALLD